MTIFRLILRNLAYFRGVNVAVIAGIATATAVLSGAMMVGDSVKESLSDLAVVRLGKIDQALISPRFFDATLAERLANNAKLAGNFEFDPAIIENGTALAASNGARTAGVQILGEGAGWAGAGAGAGKCILNGEAAAALDLKSAGGAVVLSLPSVSDMPADAILAHRSRQDAISGMRADVAQIVSEPGMVSLFTPTGGQRTPENVWVNLADLQDAVDQAGKVNTLFVHDKFSDLSNEANLAAALGRVMTLEDYGLKVTTTAASEASLTSRTIYLEPAVERAAEQTGIAIRKISVNLINAVQKVSGDGQVLSSIHYAVAAGISPMYDSPLGDDEANINQWTADQLNAKVGDVLALTFYVRGPDGELAETNDHARGFAKHFRIVRILPMEGIGADATLTPNYKGLTDAASIAEWNPPAGVIIDQKLVTKADEAYWKAHKAAPKIFLSFGAAQKLWGTSLGTATSIRVGADENNLLENGLLAHLNPAEMGMNFRPLRKQQLAAAEGSVDFGQLFLSFSFFLIVAAVLLAAMLMRLGVEQRARQLGVMAAVGFSDASLRKIIVGEQMILSFKGGVAGTIAGIGYTALMMAGLRTWWVGAVGTTALRLHVEPLTLIIGFVVGQVVALGAIWWALRQVGRAAPAELLAGGWEAGRFSRGGGRISTGLTVASVAGGAMIILTGVVGKIRPQDAFLGGGALLLVACLTGTNAALRRNIRSTKELAAKSLSRLGIRNARRHVAQSVLCVGLIALAAYALVTVAAMREGEPRSTGELRSGSGGFVLMMQTQIPLLGNLSTLEGREILGFRDAANPIWDKVQFVQMRRRAGQDVSCLNLTQPTNPAILGVPQGLVDRGGFTFASAPSGGGNPWAALDRSDESGEIPIFADDSTAQYILHLSPGDIFDITDASGATRHLKLAGTLAGSVFQSELLMSERNFRALFPQQSGFSTVLVGCDVQDQEQVRRMLSDELGDYGANVRTMASVLGGYLQVQNTYLSTFEMLGALGLMLGTIGLAVVLVRTVIERRAELALLGALGFDAEARVKLTLAENVFLLVAGLGAGTGCALVGVLPALVKSGREINFWSLVGTLLGALVCGLCASGAAVLVVGRRVGAADLRRE